MANFTSTTISGIIDEVTLASGSILLNGTNQYLTVPANAAFAFGTGDFTVEVWVRATGSSVGRITTRQPAAGLTGSWGFNFSSTSFAFTEVVAGEPGVTASGLPTMLNTWTHLAACRQGTTLRLFANGVQVGTGTFSNNLSASTQVLSIGAAYETFYSGYISNLHIVKGTALYTSNFIPPQGPIKRIGNTSLLLDMQPLVPFADDSVNNFTVTQINAPTFNNVGPFNSAPPSIGTSQNVPMRQFRDGTIMISGFYDEVGDFTPAPSYAAGLYKTTYNGYFSDTPTWFATATPTTFGANPATSVQTTIIQEPATDDGTNFSVQWLGYFLPATTETYTFYTSSDDGSFMWIGANALSGFTTGNATVSNGGAHAQTETSGTAALTAGVYYPIRIQFGEIGGGDVMSFNFSTATITKTTNVTGRVFYNPATNGF